MSAPRVLLSAVALAQPMGGVVRHNRELLPRLAALLAERGGHLALMEGREPPAFELPDEIERLPSSVPPRPAFARAAAEGRALRAHLAAAAARGAPFDLVHTAHLPAPRTPGTPYTLTLHDLKSLSPVARPLAQRLFGRAVIGDAVRRAALVLVVSEALGRELRAHFELDPERVRVVPNAGGHLEVQARAAGNAMLYVGHVEPRKNIEVVLRALALDRELPELLIAGAERGEEGERLRALAAALGVRSRVRFLGHQADDALAHQYAAARCVVLPSQREGFGIPILEAQRARAPLAVADLPALVEVAGDDVPRFPPTDAEACARALRRALETDSGTLERHAQRAARFDWDRSAELWLAALEAARAQGS